MSDFRMGMVEAKFADIIWANEPVTTRQLVTLCEEELNWKRTTTYTVLKKLCDRKIFKTEDSIVTTLISKEEFESIQSEQFVEETFNGSLPAFIAAFSKRKSLSAKEIKEIREMIDQIEVK